MKGIRRRIDDWTWRPRRAIQFLQKRRMFKKDSSTEVTILPGSWEKKKKRRKCIRAEGLGER